ncbi:hypothetical protein [Nocardia sp. NPDC052566]|uniref:hypothetical protein n=1 Tax=Nocardia sp. NPDC052566 TaxID=3364330 RepID=UPI0037C5F5F5
MSKFEDRLLGDLIDAHGPELAVAPSPAPRQFPRRPVSIAVAAVALAGASIVAIDLLGASPQAFAVVRNDDGSVTVSISDMRAIDATNAKLAEMGIRAKVLPMGKECPELDESTLLSVANQPDSHYTLPQLNPDGSVTLQPTAAPPGYLMLLGLAGLPGGTGIGRSFTAPVRAPGPNCLYLPGTLEPVR